MLREQIVKNVRTTHILQDNLKHHRNSTRRRTRSQFCSLRRHRIGATYRLPMRSTYGWDPPWAASTPLPFSLLYMPRDTPFVIAFISVYTDADAQEVQREPVRTHSLAAVQAVGRSECIPILRASSRWKPSRSATTKAHAIMIGARFTTVNFFTRTCVATPRHMLLHE